MTLKLGSLLVLIGAILSFIAAALFLAVGILVLLLPSIGDAVSAANNMNINASPIAVGITLLVLFIVSSIFGVLKVKASHLMKDLNTLKKGSLIAIIVGVVSGLDILSIVGGIIGIVQSRI